MRVRIRTEPKAVKLMEVCDSVKFLSSFVLLLLVLTFAARAVGEGNSADAELGSFVTSLLHLQMPKRQF